MVVTMQDTGRDVLTRDGTMVGKVKEVAGSYFKVDAPMRPDFWLDARLVAGRDSERLLLDFEKSELPMRRRAEPGLEAVEDPMAAIAGERVIPEEELLRQRALMEEEMAEQSVKLPPHEPSVTQARGPRPYERIPTDHAAFREHAGAYVPNHAVLHYEEMQHQSTRARSRLMMVSMIAGAITLVVVGVIGVRRMARRRRSAASPIKQRLERGKQFIRSADLDVRRLGVGPRLLRDMAARAH